jgi:hypothetical protein
LAGVSDPKNVFEKNERVKENFLQKFFRLKSSNVQLKRPDSEVKTLSINGQPQPIILQELLQTDFH